MNNGITSTGMPRHFRKGRIFVIFLLFVASGLAASAQENEVLVKFKIVDSLDLKPLASSLVTVIDSAGKVVVTEPVSDQGVFAISLAPSAPFHFHINTMGYKPTSFEFRVPPNRRTVTLEARLLSRNMVALESVEIIVTKPLVTATIEGLNYEVASDPESGTADLLDIVRKVPLLTVNSADQVTMRGSAGIKFLINGRPSASLDHQAAVMLRSMYASDIQRIEVITQPSSRYDAECVGGIINIVMKKNPDNGYSGSIGLRYDDTFGPRTNASLTARKGKFALFQTLVYNRSERPEIETGNLHQSPGNGTSISSIGQTKEKSYMAVSNTEFSYDLNTLNLLTGSLHIVKMPQVSVNSYFWTYFNNEMPEKIYEQTSSNETEMNAYIVGMNYQRAFANKKEALLTSSYNFTRLLNLMIWILPTC